MRIYLAGPITGLTMEQSLAWRRVVAAAVPPGVGILDPLRYPDEIWDGPRRAETANVHAIVRRNMFDVRSCDIVFAHFPNYADHSELSVGTISEMSGGRILGKGVICVCAKNNPHYQPYLLEMADVVFQDLDAAVTYLLHMLDEAQNLTFGERPE